ncbi:hypothetical protein C8R44DRAFT_786015 [Mycena epipterygia]|nr:hypothetical protein C8R44DRAFT_786015 [Mycena epipterygia]
MITPRNDDSGRRALRRLLDPRASSSSPESPERILRTQSAVARRFGPTRDSTRTRTRMPFSLLGSSEPAFGRYGRHSGNAGAETGVDETSILRFVVWSLTKATLDAWSPSMPRKCRAEAIRSRSGLDLRDVRVVLGCDADGGVARSLSSGATRPQTLQYRITPRNDDGRGRSTAGRVVTGWAGNIGRLREKRGTDPADHGLEESA